ncbi:MAG: type VI secretion system baseplate subunit TssK [Burkholderiales bacterium]
MPQVNRILWGEGMFLRPQHFQQQELYFEGRVAECMRLTHAHPWGLRRVELDADALQAGLLRLNRLELVFPDGTVIDAPASEPLPPARQLDALPQAGVETTVYACLPLLNAFGGNAGTGGETGPRPPRFVMDTTRVADLHTHALEAEITALRANTCLLLEQENRDGHQALPIARLVRNATGSWEQDERYLPPLVEIGAAPWLTLMLRRLLDILLVKSQALTAAHRERVKSVVEYGTSDIASFWLLHTVNRSFPLLNHLLRHPRSHPEQLYLALAQLGGELLTFSSNLGLNDLPLYWHEALGTTFAELDGLIRELLETVISSRYAVIPLVNTKPSFYVGRLESERLLENADFYLSVSTDMPTAEVMETLPAKLKVGAPDDVEKILNSALPGVKLAYATQTPVALPVRVGNHYFALEPHGAIYERMLKARSICLYVPQALPEMKLELLAAFR